MADYVEVYGVRVQVGCAPLLETVMKFGGSSSGHKRKQADRALEKLGEKGCVSALHHVVQEFSGSSSGHKRELAEEALEMI